MLVDRWAGGSMLDGAGLWHVRSCPGCRAEWCELRFTFEQPEPYTEVSDATVTDSLLGGSKMSCLVIDVGLIFNKSNLVQYKILESSYRMGSRGS